MLRHVLPTLLVTVIHAGPLLAQTPDPVLQTPDPVLQTHGPGLLELPASTRALGLGGAFPLAENDSDVLFANPARLGDGGISFSAQRFGGDGGTLLSMSGSTDWWGAGVGVGFRMLEYGAAAERPLALPADEAELTRPGSLGATEYEASAGYARSLFGLEVGVAGKLIGFRLAGSRSTVVAADVGVAREVGPFTVGLAAQNLGPDLELAGDELPLPRTVTLAASSETVAVGPLDLSFAGRVTRDGRGEIIPGGGVEVAWWPVVGRTFVARIGTRRAIVDSVGPVTFGGAFYGDRIGIEYGYQPYDEFDGAHRFGIAWR